MSKHPVTLIWPAALALLALTPSAPAQCQPQVLSALSPAPYEQLGSTVRMDGDLLLIGAPSYPYVGTGRGYVDVLRREGGGWVPETRLYAPAPHDYVGNEFGAAIDFRGSRAVIGAPGLNGGTAGAGGAFVVDRFGPGNWVFQVPYLVAGGAPGDRLGSAVSWDGPYVALGAPVSSFGASASGEVVLYDMNSLTLPAATVFNPAPELSARFGSDVRLVGGRLFVSAPGQDPDGAVFAFAGGPLSWTLEDTLFHANASPATAFGGGLVWVPGGLGGDLWVTSPGDDVSGIAKAGAIHRFGYQPPVFPATKGLFVLAETITSDTPTASAAFGSGLALDQPAFGATRLLTGSGSNDGHAYLFRYSSFGSNTWELQRKFQHPTLQTPLKSAALDGDTAVLGALEAGDGGSLNGGAVFLDLACVPTCGPRLPYPDPAPGDAIGQSVAVLGSMAVVGVPGDDAMGTDAGAVHVYRYDGACWYLETTLYDGSPAPGDGFGHAVAIHPDGDWVLVGAPRADGALADQGEVHLFQRVSFTPGWLQAQTLANPLPGAQAGFGSSLDVDGRTAIGAPGDGATSGAVHVFDAPAGGAMALQTTLLSPSATSEGFGSAVACEGGTVYVGNPLDDTAGADAGEVSVHAYNPFIQSWFTQQRTSGPGVAGYQFGAALDVSGARAAVGAPQADRDGQQRAGRAYVYPVSGGALGGPVSELLPPAATTDAAFGAALAVRGDRVSVGAPATGTPGSGAVYDFDMMGSASALAHVLTPQALPAGAEFGRAVATNGAHTLVGAPAGSGPCPGSAWALTDSSPIAAVTTYCTAGTSASGCNALVSATGVPSATATSGFTLSASSVPGGKSGLFFFGTGGRQAQPWGSGTSFQCVAPPVKRAGLLSATGSSGQCDGSFAQDLNALWCPTCPKPLHNPGPGALVQAQLWYRDPASTSNQPTSLSDAVEFCVGP